MEENQEKTRSKFRMGLGRKEEKGVLKVIMGDNTESTLDRTKRSKRLREFENRANPLGNALQTKANFEAMAALAHHFPDEWWFNSDNPER